MISGALEPWLQPWFEQALVGMAFVNPRGRIIRANQRFAQILGYEPAELTRCPIADIVHPEDRDATRSTSPDPTAKDALAACPIECRYLRKDHAVAWISLTRSVIRDPAQRKVLYELHVVEDISDRKRVEEQRRESERRATAQAQQIEASLAAVADGVIIFDADGRIRHANPALRALLEVPEDFDLSGLRPIDRSRIFRMRHPDGRVMSEAEIPTVRALKGERLVGASSADEILRTFRSRDLELSVTAAPLTDESGTITGGVAVLRDVTERRQLERRAQELARRLEATFDAMSDAVLIYDRTGRVVQCNEAVNAILGPSASTTLASMSLAERSLALLAWDEDGRPIVGDRRAVPRLLRGEILRGESASDERVRTLDGREIWTSNSGAPIRGPHGTIVGAVLVIRDVTERRRLVQRMRDSLAVIVDTARALVLPPSDETSLGAPASIHTHLAQCVSRVLGQDAAASVVLVGIAENSTLALLATVDVSPDDVKCIGELVSGRTVEQLAIDPEHPGRLRAGEALIANLNQAPFNRTLLVRDLTQLLIIPLRVGSRLAGLVGLKPSRPEYVYADWEIELAEAVAGLAAIVIDRARMRREREEAVTRVRALEEAQRRMDEFLGIASHELRTPLTSIKASLQLTAIHVAAILSALRDQADGEPGEAVETLDELLSRLDRAHRLLARSDRHVGRLTRLVSDMLDVSRIQSGKLALRRSRVDLVTLVAEVVEDQRLEVPSRTIHFDASTLCPALVDADPERIRQVLENYLLNALKFSRPDQPIQVAMSMRDSWIRVEVRDEGPGLSPEQQRQLWDRFYRAADVPIQSGSGLGLGLGLFISRSIVQRHGGRVGVESAPGEGSTFWFNLPLSKD